MTDRLEVAPRAIAIATMAMRGRPRGAGPCRLDA